MNIGIKIKQLRKQRSLTQQELAKELDCSFQIISEWESGKVEPRPNMRKKLADFFGINEAELFSEESIIPKEAIPSKKQIKIPLLGRAPAGAKSWVADEIEDWYDIPKELIKGRKVYLLRIEGDSMIEEGIKDKSLIVVDFGAEVKNGDIVVVRIDDETVIKKFYRRKDHIVLQSANPNYEPQVYTSEDNVELRGKVVAVWMELK